MGGAWSQAACNSKETTKIIKNGQHDDDRDDKDNKGDKGDDDKGDKDDEVQGGPTRR